MSPETARKAINVLVDLGIMDVRHGSGAYIASKEKAQSFLDQYKDVQSIQEIRKDILESVERQQQELDNFSELLNVLVRQTKKVHNMSPFLPFELLLKEDAQHLEKSVHEYLASNGSNHRGNPNGTRVIALTRPLRQV